jgi:hypothetical protein
VTIISNKDLCKKYFITFVWEQQTVAYRNEDYDEITGKMNTTDAYYYQVLTRFVF